MGGFLVLVIGGTIVGMIVEVISDWLRERRFHRYVQEKTTLSNEKFLKGMVNKFYDTYSIPGRLATYLYGRLSSNGKRLDEEIKRYTALKYAQTAFKITLDDGLVVKLMESHRQNNWEDLAVEFNRIMQKELCTQKGYTWPEKDGFDPSIGIRTEIQHALHELPKDQTEEIAGSLAYYLSNWDRLTTEYEEKKAQYS